MMSVIRRVAWIVLCVVILSLAGTPSSHASRTYSFPSVEIKASVLEDGSMRVVEQRTVNFQGTFSGMYQWIPKTGGIQIQGVVVEEDGVPYQFNPGSTYGPAGTYYIVEEADRLYVDWSFKAQDQTRTFILRYVVVDAVQVHNDVAELYYKFVGDEWEVPADRAVVHLTLPLGAQPKDVKAWGHGPLHGEVSIKDPGNVLWKVSPLPAKTFLEGRVVFPPALVPSALNVTGQDALEAILREEDTWAAQANRLRYLAQLEWLLALLVLLGAVIGVYLFWRKYGREHRPSFQGDYYRELPGEYTPAELGVLWRFGRTAAEDLTATILDLARKGWVRIEEYEAEARGFLRRRATVDYRLKRTDKSDPLLAHEESLLTFLFDKVGNNGSSVSFDDIEAYSRSNRTGFTRFWMGWKGLVADQARSREFFDPRVKTGKTLEIIVGVAILFAGFAILPWQVMAASIAFFVTGAAFIVAAIFLRRRSVKGAEDFVRWRAFRRFLLHFSEMERHEIPSLVVWEHFLVYAVTLGVAREVIKQLPLVFGDISQGPHRFGHGWYIYRGGEPAFSGMATTFDSLTSRMTSSLERSLRTATSSSSSSGGGGGFSGGGGGGRGGGGGGVR